MCRVQVRHGSGADCMLRIIAGFTFSDLLLACVDRFGLKSQSGLMLIDRRTERELPLDEPVLKYYSDIRSGADDVFLIDLLDERYEAFVTAHSTEFQDVIMVLPSEKEAESANETRLALVDVESQGCTQSVTKSVDLEGVCLVHFVLF
jgi:hypothetical protein